jgi:hypothetical protein
MAVAVPRFHSFGMVETPRDDLVGTVDEVAAACDPLDPRGGGDEGTTEVLFAGDVVIW